MDTDEDDIVTLGMRLDFVVAVHEWVGQRLDSEILQVALDAVPIGGEVGYAVVWLPYQEGDYVAHWCRWRGSVLWHLWKARRQRSLMSFVLDVSLTLKESGGSCCGH